MVPDDEESSLGGSLMHEQLARLQAYHDIRASMATINGLGQALDTSFNELVQRYESAVPPLSADADAQIQELRHDCRFHLSRLVRVVEQLNRSGYSAPG